MPSSVEVTLQNSPITLDLYTGGQPGPQGDPGEIVFPVPTVESELNSTATPLDAGETFTGTGEQNSLPDVFVSAVGSHAFTLYLDQSVDGTNWDSVATYEINAGENETHVTTKGGRFFRMRAENTSGQNMTYLRIGTYFGSFCSFSRPLDSVINSDADAAVVRSTPPEAEILSGRIDGMFVINKYGRNSDVDTGSVPEDVWEVGGTYTGFPVGAAAASEAVSTSAGDTGTLTVQGLRTETSTEYETLSVTLNGITPVSLGNWWRINRANYDSGDDVSFNSGVIIIRRTASPATIFCAVPAGYGQVTTAVWTIPFGHDAYLRRLQVEVSRATNAYLEGCIWIRPYGQSPRLTRFFSVSDQSPHILAPAYGVPLEARTDIAIRIITTSTSNMIVQTDFDILHVRS